MSVIHPTAVIENGAEIGADVAIGPYCVISANAKIGDGSQLKSHVVIEGHTTIGKNCKIFPFACIGGQTQDLKFKGGVTYVEIGDGTTIRECATVNSGTNEGEVTKVGSFCLVMAYSHVAHGCKLGSGVIMANSVNLAGHVIIEDLVTIGGITGVHQFVRIGRMAMVGGCSAITQDVAPFMLVDGNPARTVSVNVIGLKRKGVTDESQQLLKKAFKFLFKDGLSTSQAIEKINTELGTNTEISHLVDFIKKSERGIIK